jgi:hypothetical protein
MKHSLGAWLHIVSVGRVHSLQHQGFAVRIKVNTRSRYGVAHMKRRKDRYVDGLFLRWFLANSDTVANCSYEQTADVEEGWYDEKEALFVP